MLLYIDAGNAAQRNAVGQFELAVADPAVLDSKMLSVLTKFGVSTSVDACNGKPDG
jgi:hypothetical protein